MSKSDIQPILVFDKDDVDTLDFVAASANLRSTIFGIEPRSKFDIKREYTLLIHFLPAFLTCCRSFSEMAGNIIPAIATTNAMTAGLCVLQALKVLKGDLENAKMVRFFFFCLVSKLRTSTLVTDRFAFSFFIGKIKVFLEKSGSRAINSDSLKPPNPNCPVCSVAQGRITIDPDRATLYNLVQDVLRLQLGYGEEFSLSSEIGTIYDPDLEDNLSKKLSELGVKGETLVTVVDEEDEQPRVNLELLIHEQR